MADYEARSEKADIGVTTGPIRGSRKIHVAVPSSPDVRVAMREIAAKDDVAFMTGAGICDWYRGTQG